MLIRGRGKEESGLLFTKPSEVVAADFDGQKLDQKELAQNSQRIGDSRRNLSKPAPVSAPLCMRIRLRSC